MDSFFLKKVKLLDVFFYALAFYPLLKLNLSSIILTILFFLTAYNSYRHRTLSFSKRDFKLFFLTSLYLIIVLISVFYSENKGDAVKRTTRLVPLLVLPAILIFCKPKINPEIRNRILNVYLVVNIIYIVVLFSIYCLYIKTSGIDKFSFVEMISNRSVFHPIIIEYLGEDILVPHKAYISMGFVISAIFSLEKAMKLDKNKIKRLIYVTTFFFFTFFLLAFFSFPNVIALILSIITYIIYNVKKLRKKRISLSVISLVSVCGMSLVIYFKSDNIDVKRGLNFMESLFKKEHVELNDPRIEIYKSVKSIYQKANLMDVLFGFGIGDVQDKLNNEYATRLIKTEGKNKLLFSEEFNDDYWYKNNIDVISNKVLSPAGLKKADILKERQTEMKSSYNISNKIISETEKEFTFSVYAKKGTAEHLILRLGDIQQRAIFDLYKGENKSFNNLVKSKINKEGEWYRCSITTQIKGEATIVIGISNDKSEYKYFGGEKELYLWGAQLEEGSVLTPFVKNDSELLKYISEKGLNTHNNYLYFLLIGGFFCLLSFLMALGVLFFISLRNKDVLQLTFCIILATNFLTENTLSRHLGLIFISFMLLIFFTKSQNKIGTEI